MCKQAESTQKASETRGYHAIERLKEKVCVADEREKMKQRRQEKSITLSAHFLTHSPCLILNPTSIHSAAEFNSAAQWAIIIIYGCPRTAAGIYYWLTERALECVREFACTFSRRRCAALHLQHATPMQFRFQSKSWFAKNCARLVKYHCTSMRVSCAQIFMIQFPFKIFLIALKNRLNY